MDKAFKIGLVLSVFAVAIALFQSAQNSRYQYSSNGGQGIIADTRTGEFWAVDGSHFLPRSARITAHHPLVEDETAQDDRANTLHSCLVGHVDPKECLANFMGSQATKTAPATAPQAPSQ
jgi:hypothetical protein